MIILSVFKNIFLILTIFILSAGAVIALPSYEEIRSSYNKSDTVLLDRRGIPLYELRTDRRIRRQEWTLLRDISPALIMAVIYAEDKRFFEHSGADYISIGAAIIRGIGPGSSRGASTITMQLASYLEPGLKPSAGKRTITQKWKQIVYGLDIEKKWSKHEIMEAYLNLVSFRSEFQGIAAASAGLFGKAPHGLKQAESLILASLIRAPNAPFKDVSVRALLLGKTLGWHVNGHEVDAAGERIISGRIFIKPKGDLAPHAARLIVKKGDAGTVSCTIDAAIQNFALQSLKNHLNNLKTQNVMNGGVLVAENRTGEVLAYVSYSNDPSAGHYVDAVQAKRQAGSTLKPFLYCLAFEKKILTPASVLDDAPLDITVFSGIYRPHNYESGFQGFVTSRTALGSSLNIPAVRAINLAGIESFLAKLRGLGIKGLNESGDFYGPSLALGSADVSLWELTNAYRCLANEGISGELRFIAGGAGQKKSRRVYTPESVFLVSDVLSDREARSSTFGLENPLSTRFRTAVKTGTSKDMRDNWCIGYSGKYTVGVWVGNFTGEPMWNVSGISGAAPVWADIMNRLHYKDDNRKRGAPLQVVRKNVDFPASVERRRDEWFIAGTEPYDKTKNIGQLNIRIIYPPGGATIAVDPDIPAELQKIFFIATRQEKDQRWVLSPPSSGIETIGSRYCWSPEPGLFTLSLLDGNGSIIDSVNFEVR